MNQVKTIFAGLVFVFALVGGPMVEQHQYRETKLEDLRE